MSNTPSPPCWATASTQLERMNQSFAQTRQGSLSVMAFSELARQQATLSGALPPRYGEVLLQLLDRLESSALFSEESCSFSQKELFDSLQMWLDKAGGALQAHRPQDQQA